MCRHQNKTFKRYIDTETRQYVADHAGKCDREDKCGYHYTPREYFKATPGSAPVRTAKIKPSPEAKTFNAIPLKYMQQSMGNAGNNNFLLFLGAMFQQHVVDELVNKYHIGTTNHWPGATIFWQMDITGRLRTGKVMLYNPHNGSRVKEPFNHIAWVHSLLSPKSKVLSLESQLTSDLRLSTQDFILQQCFFGEHLLALEPAKPVAIAESEKTAIMASIMMPGFIWLAAGSKHGLDEHKCRVLANRTVLLFPDVGAFDYWTECARTLNRKIPTATFTVHDEMEKTATSEERANGADMCDRWIGEWFSDFGGKRLELLSRESPESR